MDKKHYSNLILDSEKPLLIDFIGMNLKGVVIPMSYNYPCVQYVSENYAIIKLSDEENGFDEIVINRNRDSSSIVVDGISLDKMEFSSLKKFSDVIEDIINDTNKNFAWQ